MLEFLIEVFGEVFFQLLFELFGAIIDGTFDLSSRSTRAILKVVFYLFLGAMLAVCSYAIWPHPLLIHSPHPLISLIFVPLVVACSTVVLSQRFEKKWDWDLETSRFGYSFLLAIVFAGTRYALLFARVS